MSHILETMRCRDRWGREIVLTDDVWYGKILRKRAHFATALSALQRTLTDPEQVNQDRTFGEREVFYRQELLPPPDGWSILKVVVAFVEGEGRVVTAFATFNVHPEERCLWLR